MSSGPQEKLRERLGEPLRVATALPAADADEELVELGARERPHGVERLGGRERERSVRRERVDERRQVAAARVVKPRK